MKQPSKRRRWPYILCAVIAVLVVLGVAWREPIRTIWYGNVDPENPLHVDGEWAGGTAYKNVQYSEVSETDYLNLYVPDTDAPAPLIVLIHGGGFVMNDCESRQAQLFYQYFRDHGYACATVNYRLAQEAKFPAAVQDVKCAIRYLKTHAGEYGYNADKVTVWGESAGGYLCVMAGVTNDDEFNDLPFIGETDPVSAKVDVILDYYGAVKLESKADRNKAFAELGIPAIVTDIANGWLKAALKDLPGFESCEDAWIGKRFEELSEEEIQAVSPLYYAEKNLNSESGLKALIWHGDADITVPITQSEQLYEIMADRLGTENVTFGVIKNARHADEDMYSDEKLSELKEWLDAALAK